MVDLAKGHVKAIENLKDGVNIYNLGIDEVSSVLELVNAFMKVNDIDVPYEIVGSVRKELPPVLRTQVKLRRS